MGRGGGLTRGHAGSAAARPWTATGSGAGLAGTRRRVSCTSPAVGQRHATASALPSPATTNHTVAAPVQRGERQADPLRRRLRRAGHADGDRVVDVELRGAGEQRRDMAVRARRRASPRRTRPVPWRATRSAYAVAASWASSCGPSRGRHRVDALGVHADVVEQRLARLLSLRSSLSGGRRTARPPTRVHPAPVDVAPGRASAIARWIASAMRPPVSTTPGGPRFWASTSRVTSRAATAAASTSAGQDGGEPTRVALSGPGLASAWRASIRPGWRTSRRRCRPGRVGAAPRPAARRARAASARPAGRAGPGSESVASRPSAR